MKQKTILCGPDGSVIAVNRGRLTEIPYWFSTNRPDNSISVPANGASDPLSITIPGDGPADIAAISASVSGVCLIALEIEKPDGQKVSLSNGVIHSSNILGNNTNPFWFPEPLRILEGHRLVVSITDISGAVNVVRLCLHAAMDTKPVIDEKRMMYKEIQHGISQISLPWFSVLDNGRAVLTANQAVEKAIALPDGCSFHLKAITGISTGAFTLDIVDANTGESLIDAPRGTHYGLSNSLIVGTAQYPFDLPFPRMFTKNQKIITRLVDTSAAGNTIYLCYAGRLVRDYVGRPIQ